MDTATMWREMLSRSFSPRQWFVDEDDPAGGGGDSQEGEGKLMWVYRQTEPGTWTVGFYAPDRTWHSESDHGSKEAAAERVRWLNGGN